MNDEGLADAAASDPFHLPKLHQGRGDSTSRTSPACDERPDVTMGYSMGYADVDALLAELLPGVRGTLGPQLVAVYLDGSLATGEETRSVGVVERGLSRSHRVQHVAPRSHPVFPVRVEQFAQARAGAVEPRAYRADWQLESLGYALVREFLPCEEQERLALAVRQRLDRVGHPREQHARVERPGTRAPVRRLQTRRHL